MEPPNNKPSIFPIPLTFNTLSLEQQEALQRRLIEIHCAELDDGEAQIPPQTSGTTSTAQQSYQQQQNPPSSSSTTADSTPKKSSTISAPTSPTRSNSLLQRVQSLTGVAKEVGATVSQAISQQVTSSGGREGIRFPQRKADTYYLLVIDDAKTEWSKYFRSKKINNCEIIVEQTELSQLSIVGTEVGAIASYTINGSVHSFQPDFILFRQNLRDAGKDYKNLIISLMYGGVQSVNSLQAVYNFQDKPWVFGNMISLKKLGFPLIEQVFYPDFRQMSGMMSRIPSVLKIGHAHAGIGKLRIGSTGDWQDAAGVVAVTGTYCTSEPYIEARCEVHIQKIGSSYKAFMRKGIERHWKSNSGSGILEQVTVSDKYKAWIDAVANLFGGLDICELEVIVGKDGREYIIEVNDSAMTLLGESQEEDRRLIAELVMARMQFFCKQADAQPKYRRMSGSSETEGVMGRRDSIGQRRDSQGSGTTTNKFFTRQSSQSGEQPEAEDTMKNLRKTFAGIFGDM